VITASDRAIAAAKAKVIGQILTGWQELEQGIAGVHDPSLGLDRSVCLRDVVEALDRDWHGPMPGAYRVAAEFIRAEFAGDESHTTPTTEG
jgi:hypothetical protein